MNEIELTHKLPTIRTSKMFPQKSEIGEFRLRFERWDDRKLDPAERITPFADDLQDYSDKLREHAQSYRQSIQRHRNWRPGNRELSASLPAIYTENYMFVHEGRVGALKLDFDESRHYRETGITRAEDFVENLELYSQHISKMAQSYRGRIAAFHDWIRSTPRQQKFARNICESVFGKAENDSEISRQFRAAAVDLFQTFRQKILPPAAEMKIDDLFITPSRILWGGGALGGVYGVGTGFRGIHIPAIQNFWVYELYLDAVGLVISGGIAASGAAARHIPGPIGGLFSHINLAVRSFMNFHAVVRQGMQGPGRPIIREAFIQLMREELGRPGGMTAHIETDGKFKTAISRGLLRTPDVETTMMRAIKQRIEESEVKEDPQGLPMFDKILSRAANDCAQIRFHRIWFAAAAAGRRRPELS